MIPRGVTIRQAHEPIPAIARPRNLIESAAHMGRDEAIKTVREALGLQDTRLADLLLSEGWRWDRIDPASRLMEIAEWLRAEAYECMDLVQSRDPNDTVGTRD